MRNPFTMLLDIAVWFRRIGDKLLRNPFKITITDYDRQRATVDIEYFYFCYSASPCPRCGEDLSKLLMMKEFYPHFMGWCKNQKV